MVTNFREEGKVDPIFMGEFFRSMAQHLDQAPLTFYRAVENLLAGYPFLALVVGLLLATVPLVIIFPTCFAFATWLERKGLARIQNRIGPNRVGPFGLLQPAADGIKMLFKEDIVPRSADRLIHTLAPIVVAVPAFGVLGFLPIGRNLTAVLLGNALIFFFALGSVSTLAVFMAGWSARNKYSLLGGLRAIAQMISYEIPLVLAAVPVVMMSGTLSTTAIVEAQSGWGWNVMSPWGLVAFLIFFTASLAETNRAPFDLPEAESEIIAGHLTEYSGFKYALFFLAEYVSMFAISGLAVTLFLGGWHGPWPVPSYLWFFGKMFALVGLMIWVRGTFPRLRADQLMGFAWKFLMPLALWNVLVTGLVFFLPRLAGWAVGSLLLVGGYALLARLNQGAKKFSTRIYRYADN